MTIGICGQGTAWRVEVSIFTLCLVVDRFAIAIADVFGHIYIFLFWGGTNTR
jgi:hypothetical protein